jgi:hypothetical protein
MRRVVPIAVASLVVVVLVGLGRSRGAPLEARSCTRAVMVDSLLRCDSEAPVDLAAVCGPTHPREPIAAGDAIEADVACAQGQPERDAPGWGRMPAADLRALTQPVDLNRADLAELRSLPGIGPKIARRIVEGRPYAEVDEVVRVRGIGPKTLERLRPRLVAPAAR